LYYQTKNLDVIEEAQTTSGSATRTLCEHIIKSKRLMTHSCTGYIYVSHNLKKDGKYSWYTK